MNDIHTLIAKELENGKTIVSRILGCAGHIEKVQKLDAQHSSVHIISPNGSRYVTGFGGAASKLKYISNDIIHIVTC